LEVKDFRFIPEFTSDSEKTYHGLIAQQVETVAPYAVSLRSDGYMMVDYRSFIPLLIKSIQDQQIEIQALSVNLQGNLNGNVNQDALAVVDASFQGNLKVKGQVAFGQDTVGQAKILVGVTEEQVNFTTPYENQPIVTLTLASDNYLTKYYVASASSTGFIIKIEPQQTEKDVLFNWHAFGSEIPLTVVETSVPVIETPPPVAEAPASPLAETQDPTVDPVVQAEELVVVPPAPIVEPVVEPTPLPVVSEPEPPATVVETPPPALEVPPPEPAPQAEPAPPLI